MVKGERVRFAFTLDPAIGGTPAERRREGIGEIASDDPTYQCWPPGRVVKVIVSKVYPPGAIIAVCTFNLTKETP